MVTEFTSLLGKKWVFICKTSLCPPSAFSILHILSMDYKDGLIVEIHPHKPKVGKFCVPYNCGGEQLHTESGVTSTPGSLMPHIPYLHC